MLQKKTFKSDEAVGSSNANDPIDLQVHYCTSQR